MSEPAPAILTEKIGHVLLITINRPEARNACNQAVWLGAGEALAAAEQDIDVRAIVVTGAGEQAFCAGADLKAIARGEAILPEDPIKAGWGFAGIVSHTISKPLIAAVNGAAVGGGTELALACDIVVAVEEASFGLPEVKRGLVAAAGGCFRLMRQIPRKIAMELMFTGDTITAARALELGMVNHVVPRAQLMETALGLAARIAGNAPLSVRASKRIALEIDGDSVTSEVADWARTAHEADVVRRSDDAREGPRAFAEKRDPIWTGR